MGIGFLRNFDQLVDDMLGRRQVRIAHAEVNNVLTRRTGGRSHRIHFSDDIGRQALHAVEFFGHRTPEAPCYKLDQRTALMRDVLPLFQQNRPSAAGYPWPYASRHVWRVQVRPCGKAAFRLRRGHHRAER